MPGKKTGVLGRAARACVRTVKDFWSGFRYPFKGARFVYIKHLGLARFWIWPIIITALVFTGVAACVWLFHDDLLALMWAEPTGDGAWAGVQRVIRPVAQVILFIVLIVAGLFAVYVLTSLFAAPFNDMLSEEVERISLGREAPPFSLRRLVRDLLMTLRLELSKAVIYVLVMIPAFILSLLVPVVGQVVYAIFGYFFTMVFFAIDYTDWPLARRGWGVRRRIRILRANLARMLGLGAAVWLLLIIPFVGLMFMPAAVAGGTLLVLDLEDEGALDWQSEHNGPRGQS